MKREIKFRAWCDYHKVIIPNYCHLDEDLRFNGYDLTNNTHGISAVMQYTGLKDKEGVEIYEGDIVRISSNGERYIGLLGEVKILEGGQFYIDHQKVTLKYQHQIHCEVCDTESPVFFLNYFDSYELEIIGNAFQHPHLLK